MIAVGSSFDDKNSIFLTIQKHGDMVVPAIGIQKCSAIKSMSCSIFSQGKMWALLRLVWLMRILHFPFHLAPPLHYQVRLGIFLNKTKEEQFLHFLSYDLIFK